MRVIVADDEAAVREVLGRALSSEGYAVLSARDGREALDMIDRHKPDAAVLDVRMPPPDGVEVCRQLRAAKNPIPILILTARGGVADRVAGLDAGADDFLAKPFALDELLARLRAILRRAPPVEGRLAYADVLLDAHEHRVWRDGERITVTPTEFALLELLLSKPERVLTRSEMLDAAWGYDFGHTSRSLDVYIGYLRRKLEENGKPRLIHTVRGVGYLLHTEP